MTEAQGLAVCASEPIHIPGAIQDFGCLLVLGPDGMIRHVSANAWDYFSQEPKALLGLNIADIIDNRSCADVLELVRQVSLSRRVSWHRLRYAPEGDKIANVSVHHKNDLRVVEFERCIKNGVPQTERQYLEQQRRIQACLYQVLSKLHDASSLLHLCQEAIDAIRLLTGYDRVMVYRFDDQWRGCVLVERKCHSLATYLGQFFPASDIPPQAREVFFHNASRMISDIASSPVALVPTLDPLTGTPFDMEQTQVRAPSAVHLEYLANMGVQGTLTLSLLVEGKLWGLVACHHRRAKVTDVAHREAAEIVAKALSALIPARLHSDNHADRAMLRGRLEQLLGRLHISGHGAQDLLQGPVNIANLWAPSPGSAAVFMDGAWFCSEDAPDIETCEQVVSWLRQNHDASTIFYTNHVSRVLKGITFDAATCSGIMAIRLIEGNDGYVLWFAPEVPQSIDWAGRPEKVFDGPQSGRIHPRQSFARWREEVREHSVPWTDLQLEAAMQLRRGLLEWDLARQVQREQAARRDVEAERQRFGLLAAASAFFGKPLADGAALQGLAQFLTQQFCDWVVITGTDQEHSAHEASAHCDAQKADILSQANEAGLVVPELVALLEEAADPLRICLMSRGYEDAQPAFNICSQLGVISCVALPLVVHGRALGHIYFVRDQNSQHFMADDVRLATQLAERVSGVLDNDRSYRQSQSAIRSREYVLRIVSHDLRNPLGLVSLSSQSLRRRFKAIDTIAWREPINRIDRACGTMDRLIDDVLSAANIESGSFVVRQEWLDGQAFMAELAQSLDPLCHASQIVLRTDVSQAADKIYADKNRLLQAIGNLVSNAIRFTPIGGSITLQALRRNNEVVFTIRDTGEGIAEAKIGKIFDQFWQGDQGEQSGAGLGLFIVRGVVQQHGGHIWVESAVGEGTTFSFTCPDEG